MRRTFTDRQIAIIDLIRERKQQGAETITLDEVAERVKRWGLGAHRNSLVVSMNILVERLTESGVYIEKVKTIGRSKRQRYRIKRPEAQSPS